jgi:hypothetical protein
VELSLGVVVLTTTVAGWRLPVDGSMVTSPVHPDQPFTCRAHGRPRGVLRAERRRHVNGQVLVVDGGNVMPV